MTETQAKSGTAGASTTPAEGEATSGGAPATGRAVVGRAVVPADAPSPKFTRAPGMPPPPEQPGEDSGDAKDADGASASTTQPVSIPSTGTSTVDSSGPKSGTARPSAGPTAAGAGGAAKATTGTARPGAGATSRFGPVGGQSRAGAGAGSASAGGAGAVGAARVTDAVRAARGSVSSAASRGPRRARLNVKRIDPWSVMKFSFAVSLVLFIVVIVATSVLYLALDAMGVFDSVNSGLGDLMNASGSQGGSAFKITAKGVILTSGLIGLVNVVLFTALATLGAFVYNVCADLVGGIELTLAERD